MEIQPPNATPGQIGSIVKQSRTPFSVRSTVRKVAGAVLLLSLLAGGFLIYSQGVGRDPVIKQEIFAQITQSTPIEGRGYELLEHRVSLPAEQGSGVLVFRAEETLLEYGPGGSVCLAFDPASPANTTFCSIARKWAPGPGLGIIFSGLVLSLVVVAFGEIQFRAKVAEAAG